VVTRQAQDRNRLSLGARARYTPAAMIVTESRSGRRIVGRLDRGASLLDALLDVCRQRGVRTGEVRAVGSLEIVEVAEYDQARKAWKPGRSFTGGVEILSLTGNVSERNGQLVLHAHAALMRERDNGVEVLGGHVVGARVFALEFVIDAFDDVLLRRGHDPATGLPLWTEAIDQGAERRSAPGSAEPSGAPRADAPAAATATTPAPTPASEPTTWADVARVSEAETELEPEPESADSLEAGDIIMHPTFGRCEVQRIEGGGEFAQVRLRNGRLVRLALDVLQVVRAGTEGGHRVFRARVND